MKKIYLASFVFLGLFFLSACSSGTLVKAPEAENQKVDNIKEKTTQEQVGISNFEVNTAASVVKWSAQKVLVRTNDHFGTIGISNGQILIDGQDFVGGDITIDMTSIKDIDLTSQTSKETLEKHLKSSDFFDVEKYPEAKFVISKVEKIDDEDYNYLVTGDMTIKDKTNEISTKVNIDLKENMINAKATFDIDRTKWGIIYGSGNFFKELGDNVIDDMISFDIRIVAEK